MYCVVVTHNMFIISNFSFSHPQCEHLQSNMAALHSELLVQHDLVEHTKLAVQLADEDLATTRLNYEEQISVLTEQLISLSDQLALAAS